jgi:hypothetical protein
VTEDRYAEGWLVLACPDCGALEGEECFMASRLWGKVPCPMHPARILAVVRQKKVTT